MFLFQVVLVTGMQWERDYESVKFNSVSESADEAIAFASNYFRKNEGKICHYYDYGCVKVVKYPLGLVIEDSIGLIQEHNCEVVWRSQKDINIITVDLRKLSQSISQEGLSLLFDSNIPSEVHLDPYFCWSQREVSIVNGGELYQSFIQSQKAQAANDLEWDLYKRYEM